MTRQPLVSVGIILCLTLALTAEGLPERRLQASRYGIPIQMQENGESMAFVLSMKITNRIYNQSLEGHNSVDYMKLSDDVRNLFQQIFGCLECASYHTYTGAAYIAFSKGSVIANSTLVFNTTMIDGDIVKFIFYNALISDPELNTSLTVDPTYTLDLPAPVPVPVPVTTTTPQPTTTSRPPTTTTSTTTATTTPSTVTCCFTTYTTTTTTTTPQPTTTSRPSTTTTSTTTATTTRFTIPCNFTISTTTTTTTPPQPTTTSHPSTTTTTTTPQPITTSHPPVIDTTQDYSSFFTSSPDNISTITDTSTSANNTMLSRLVNWWNKFIHHFFKK